MYCICCGKKVNMLYEDNKNFTWDEKINAIYEDTENSIWDGELKVMIDGGIIEKILPGYGSKFDGDEMILFICDDCVQKKLEDASLLYIGNSMFRDESIAKDIEKSKKIYHRRKNLDKLI